MRGNQNGPRWSYNNPDVPFILAATVVMSTTLKAAKNALFQYYYYSVVPNGRGRFYYSRRVSKIVILNENGYYLLLKVHSLGLLSVSVLVAFHTNWMFISVWEKFKWNFIFYFEKLKVHVQNLQYNRVTHSVTNTSEKLLKCRAQWVLASGLFHFQ